jgi:4-diphosphocytidyl-2-C-methyl-D-erythritol kinase
MQSISVFDTLSFEKTGDAVVLDTGGTLPTDERNLIVRAANAFFAAYGRRFGVRVLLEKCIPMQAGLGGGSADAAATLRALNTLAQYPFKSEELCEVGATLGADVPFCVMGGTAICRGIGEKMTPIANRVGGYLALAMAGEGVSTPWAFAELDARFGDFNAPAREAQERLPAIVAALEGGDVAALAAGCYNRFCEVIERERPAVAAVCRTMRAQGALGACMSGTGPSVFGIFATRAAAERAVAELGAQGAIAFSCEMKA